LSIVAASVAGEPRRVHAFPPAGSNTWNILGFNIGKGLNRFTPRARDGVAGAP
jgi:hypothetical protein